VAEKEEEFNNTRKNHARAMESMSASLEAEQKAKGEALRVKKALEGEINELEIGLDHANKANSEGLKSVKRYQAQLKETIQLFEDEARARSQIMEQVGISERKAAALSGELEESKALMDSSERAKRQLEMEIADGRTAVNNMQVINGRDMTAKRDLIGRVASTQIWLPAFFLVFLSVYVCLAVNSVLCFGQDSLSFATLTRAMHSCFRAMLPTLKAIFLFFSQFL